MLIGGEKYLENMTVYFSEPKQVEPFTEKLIAEFGAGRGLVQPEKQRQPSALLGVGEDSGSLPHCILSLEHHDIREQPHQLALPKDPRLGHA